MFKRPQEPDLFKHFVDDPSEVKLEAWRLLQRRLTIRESAFVFAHSRYWLPASLCVGYSDTKTLFESVPDAKSSRTSTRG